MKFILETSLFLQNPYQTAVANIRLTISSMGCFINKLFDILAIIQQRKSVVFLIPYVTHILWRIAIVMKTDKSMIFLFLSSPNLVNLHDARCITKMKSSAANSR